MDAEQHAERAHRHLQAGQWDRAVEELQEALRVVPDQSDWLLNMAEALDALQRYEEAASTYEQVLRLRGENIETLLRLGIDLIRSGQSNRALRVLERVNEIDPDCEPGYCHRIAAYIQLGDHEAAETMFYLARQVEEECPVCYDYMGQSLTLRHEFERAAWCWQQALRLEPGMVGVASSLARLYWQMDQLELSRHYLELELRENPDDTENLLALGAVLWDLGKPAEAGEKFRRALELDATLHEAHLYLGELSLLAGHLEAAEARFQRAYQINPDQPGACAGLAQVAIQRGELDEARRRLRTELQRDGFSPGQAVNLARMLIEAELAEEAVRLLDPMLTDHEVLEAAPVPTIADAFLCRGAALMMLGDVVQGVLDTKQAVTLDPDNAIGMHNLALAYLETGRLSRAAYWLRRAVELEPDEPALRHTQNRLRYRWLLARTRRALRSLLPHRSRT